MAILTKYKARNPLAESQLSLSWGSGFSGLHDDSRYRLRVQGDTHSFKLELKPKEVLSLIGFFAAREMPMVPAWSQDKRSLPEKLRALADKLEGQTDGND